MEVHRGEVFYADLSPVVGSEQGGVRPVLIVQNEIGNRHSPTVIAAAITSRLDKTRLPTHINIRAADTGLAKDSVVLLEQIRTLDKHRLRQRAGQITPEDPAGAGMDAGQAGLAASRRVHRPAVFHPDGAGGADPLADAAAHAESSVTRSRCCQASGGSWLIRPRNS